METMLKPREVQELLKISRSTLWRLIHAGMLHPVKLGPRTMRFRVDEVTRLAFGPTSASD